MNLFFAPSIQDQTPFTFDKEESRHIVKALRKKNGDFLFITDGKGKLYQGEIISDFEKKCVVHPVLKEEQKERAQGKLHLYIAPTKNIDRIEWFLEKATEIGIDTITPILCEHSERKVIKQERLEKIIVSAMKQSLQYFKPELAPLTSVNNIFESDLSGQQFIAHCEKENDLPLLQQIKPASEVHILIGPEGDFSSTEIELALKNNWKACKLGPNRLRTETAGLYAVTLNATIQPEQ